MNPQNTPGSPPGALDAEAARVAYLIAGFLRGTLTPAEHSELDRWVEASDRHMRLFEELTDEKATPSTLQWADSLHGSSPFPTRNRIGTQRSKRIYRFAPAAVAAGLLLAATTLWWLLRSAAPSPTESTVALSAPPAAGSAWAILTLGDGTAVALPPYDTALVLRDGSRVTTTGEGVVYAAGGRLAPPATRHRLQIPRGRTYRLQLGDGSRVWLNSGSSLTYPATFTGPQRSVVLSGEGYFEVAPDRAHPFLVESQGLTLRVLGTAFNVEAYTREVTTTLVEGRLQVEGGAKAAQLTPGEQLRCPPGHNWQTTRGADVAAALDWQSGLFLFRDTPLREVLTELGRWYDQEVTLKGSRSVHLTATIPRHLPLTRVLSILEGTGTVRFHLQGRTLQAEALPETAP
jgi:transmembrane sensor